MVVMMPISPARGEFNFDSTCTSPYLSCPASPRSMVPLSENHLNSQENPEDFHDTEFAFSFSGHLEMPSLSADELFDEGKIKPLKLLPRSHYSEFRIIDSTKSPRSPKRMLTKALSSPKKKDMNPPFLAKAKDETVTVIRQKGLNCLSSLTISNKVSEPKQTSSPLPSSSWCGKWKLRDFLLFRSASEGHATSKNSYALLRKSYDEDVKNLSFRSTDSTNSESSGNGRRRSVSAHERHYRKNRAAAEEMRRKTFLPYKKNLLGCIDLDPGVRDVSRGLGVEIKC